MSALNSQEVAKSLSDLLEPLAADKQDLLRNQLRLLKQKSLILANAKPPKPNFPESFRYPTCAAQNGSGIANMICIAQIDFKILNQGNAFWGPSEGVLSIFRDQARQLRHAKDRRSFNLTYFNENASASLRASQQEIGQDAEKNKLIWTMPEDKSTYLSLLQKSGIELSLAEALTDWAKSFNKLFMSEKKAGRGQLYGNNLSDLTKVRTMAAFAQSGISFSEQRAADWHYQHLVEQAEHFILLTIIFEDGEDNLESVIVIRQEDLANCDFDKGWLFTRRAI